jgi:hypothetical protein
MPRMSPELPKHIRALVDRFRRRPVQQIPPAHAVQNAQVFDSKAVEPIPPVVAEPVPALTTPIISRVVDESQRKPESKEVPYDFLLVIADDHPTYRRKTHEAVERALKLGEGNTGVVSARDSTDFFDKALVGKQGQQADVVLVDNDYSGNNSWELDADRIAKFAGTLGRDFSPFVPEKVTRRDGTSYYKGVIGDLYYPDSVNYSLLLRALGFKGRIFVVSGDPPPAERFLERAEKLRELVPNFPSERPVTGVINKGFLGGDSSMIGYATQMKSDGNWDMQVNFSEKEPIINSLLRLGDY